MRNSTKDELQQINGGLSVWGGIGIGALIVFISGLIDGIVHPKACRG